MKYIVRPVLESDFGERRFCLTSSGDEVCGKVWLNISTLLPYCEDERYSEDEEEGLYPNIEYIVAKSEDEED